MKCKAYTSNGKRCKRGVDKDYCWQHIKQHKRTNKRRSKRVQSGGGQSGGATTCTLRGNNVECESDNYKMGECSVNSNKSAEHRFTYRCDRKNDDEYGCKPNQVENPMVPDYICKRSVMDYKDNSVTVISHQYKQLPQKRLGNKSLYLVNEFKIGEKIYKVDYEKPLGSGSFGSVFKFSNQGDTIILKVIAFIKQPTKDESEEIKNEIKISKYISDFCRPYLLCFCDYFIDITNDSHIYYLISEYLGEYKTFYDIIDKHQHKIKLMRNNIKDIMLNMTKGLKVLHDMGIVHNDIHAGNIMINTDNWKDIKYIDYGMSCTAGNCDLIAYPGDFFIEIPQ